MAFKGRMKKLFVYALRVLAFVVFMGAIYMATWFLICRGARRNYQKAMEEYALLIEGTSYELFDSSRISEIKEKVERPLIYAAASFPSKYSVPGCKWSVKAKNVLFEKLYPFYEDLVEYEIKRARKLAEGGRYEEAISAVSLVDRIYRVPVEASGSTKEAKIGAKRSQVRLRPFKKHAEEARQTLREISLKYARELLKEGKKLYKQKKYLEAKGRFRKILSLPGLTSSDEEYIEAKKYMEKVVEKETASFGFSF